MPSSVLFTKVLVANRGEIALRTVRALHDLGIASVAVYADDDAASPHVHAASAAVALGATGPAAYLDGARLIAIAKAQGCDAVHPGYGFLSENRAFAERLKQEGVVFIGPPVGAIEAMGDKMAAKRLAAERGARVGYLQVEAENAPARAIYHRLGFRDGYAYHYRVPPDGG
mgnify:CR=1 FL=1